MFDLFSDALMPTHPLGRPVLGTRELVASYTHDDCRAFHDAHYVTQNAVIAAAGNVDHEQLVSLVRTCFACMPQGERTQRPEVHENSRRFLRLPAARNGAGAFRVRHALGGCIR